MGQCLAVVVVLQACLLAASPALAQPGAASPGPGLTLDRVAEIEIRMSPEDWREVRLSHRDAAVSAFPSADDGYEYRRAEIRIDGVVVAQVGVRKKGFIGSVVSTRPSLKVKFDEYVSGQSYAGLEGLTLNNNNQDQAMLQQFLAYDLYRRAGVPAPQTSFARVRVNGEDLGLYTRVETIDKAFLRRVFGNDNGVLYEGYYPGDFISGGSSQIVEKRGAKDQDRGAIGRLTEVLAAPGPLALARVAALVDVDAFIRMWAVESLIGHWDSYSGNRNNFYLYVHPSTRKLHFIPWGADSVFEDPGPLQFKPVPKSFKAEGVLARRLWEVPEIQTRYRAVMRQLLAGAWNESRLLDEMRTRQGALQPHSNFRPETVRNASARIETFIKARRAEVEAELAGPAPAWPPDPTVSATPTPVVVTGSFKAPWSKTTPANPFAGGSATINVEAAGQANVKFAQTAAFAVTYDQADPTPAPLREKYQSVTLVGATDRGFWSVTLIIDPLRFESGPGPLPVDGFNVWAIVVTQDGAGAPRLGIFGNVGELRLEETAARDGGQISGTFTIRATLP
jgi:hypothetical protein